MTARKELVAALQVRYWSSGFGERIKILDEFVTLTGYLRCCLRSFNRRIRKYRARCGRR